MEDLYQIPQNSSNSSSPLPAREGFSQNIISYDFLGEIWVYISIFVAISVLIYSLIRLIKKYINNKNDLKRWKESSVLEISVPKENIEQVQKDGGSKKDDKELISIGEQIFAVMSDYAKPSSLKTWIFGEQERFSLEIVNIDQEVRFWLVCPKKTLEVIQRQILAVYPKAFLQVLDQTYFTKPNSVAYAEEISLGIRYELPIKTYKQMEFDPLNNLTNALSGIGKDESAAIQLVLTPIKQSWQKNPRVLASKIQQGQDPKEILFPTLNIPGLFFKFLADLFKHAFNNKNESSNKTEEREIDLTGKKVAIQLTPQQQEIIKKLEEKASRQGFYCTLRIVATAKDRNKAEKIVHQIAPTFQIFDLQPFNYFKKKKQNTKIALRGFMLRSLSNYAYKQIINTEEINSIWHLPNYLTQTSNIKWLLARKPPIPLGIPGPDAGNLLLGVAASRGLEKEVYIKTEDRMRHMYALGGSGTGKSNFMTNVILQDINAGNGVCLVDPHGETVDDVLLRMPEDRIDDVIVFSPAITDKPLGLNLLEYDPLKPTQKTLVIDTLFTIWDKLYDLKATGGPMFEQYMKNSMRLVMSHPDSGATLMEISKVLSDDDFRSFKLALCDDQAVIDFWENEATKAGGDASLENMVPYITSKLSPFVTNDFLRPMIGQQKSAINFREAMDNKKIILVKLEKGLIGEGSAYVIGMVVIGKLLLAGMGRNDGVKYNLDGTTSEIMSHERSPFFVYIDEMQNFLFDAIPQALEEIRKYKVGFFLAHQFVKQVINKGDERIKDSIMANCANKFIFRAGPDDAKYLEQEFAPELTANDLMNPERFTCNARILYDGQKTTPFNMKPLLLSNDADPEKRKRIIELTKQKYGRDLKDVEQEILDRSKMFF